MTPEKRIDLHLHTFHSDGTLSPQEVIDRAEQAGLAAIALTDHDTVGGLAEAREAVHSDLELISGVELTVRFRDRELHLLGYGFRDDDTSMQQFLTEKQGGRLERMQAMIDLLNAQGVEVFFEEVEAVAGSGESIGRPHLAEVLLKKGVVQSQDEAFERYIGDEGPCFVKKATLTIPEAVQLIRDHGGVTSLAHPHRLVEDDWIPELVEQGIQGIEVFHPDHDARTSQHYEEMAKHYQLLVTGGSDCHGFRRVKGPTIGKIKVPYACLERLREALV